jgi:hypothetical protein
VPFAQGRDVHKSGSISPRNSIAQLFFNAHLDRRQRGRHIGPIKPLFIAKQTNRKCLGLFEFDSVVAQDTLAGGQSARRNFTMKNYGK